MEDLSPKNRQVDQLILQSKHYLLLVCFLHKYFLKAIYRLLIHQFLTFL